MKMKKITTFLSALVISAGMAAICSANSSETVEPSEDWSYDAYCYFKNLESEGTHVLSNGSMYINVLDIPKEGLDISTETYFVDKYMCAAGMHIRLTYGSKEIKIMGLSKSFEKYGKIYEEEDSDIVTMNMVQEDEIPQFPYQTGIYFASNDLSRLSYVTEKSDDYPLFVLDSHIKKEIELGDYKLYIIAKPYMKGGGTSSSEASLRGSGPRNHYPNLGETSEPTHILISDRMLGDVDANGVIDTKDAELVLEEYAEASNLNGGFSIAEKLAADVNTDGVIDDEDANIILTYAVSGEEISFYDYLKEISLS